MDREKENMNSLIGKIAMIGLILFIVFSFKSTDISGKDSIYQRDPIVHSVDADMYASLDKSAVQVTISSNVFNSSIATFEIFTFAIGDKNNFLAICSNNKVNQALKNCRIQFVAIKPHILNMVSYPIRTSLSSEDASSIS